MIGAAAAAFLLKSATSPAAPLAEGPAPGSSARFAVTIPIEVEAQGRTKAAPRVISGAWPPEFEIPDLPDRARRGNDAPKLGPSGTRAEPGEEITAPRPSASRGANERSDPARSASRGQLLRTKASVVLAGFGGLADAGVRPPDPVVAAGPDHVIVAVNSAWAIYTRSGSEVFETTAFGWFLPVLTQVPDGGLLPYDPQIAYDSVRGRWILLYSATDTTSESWTLLSVSSSSDPTAKWYSWALPGDVNGTAPSSNLSDFPALGWDDTAIYVASNQFRYADHGFDYAKVRILPKDPLYAGSTTAAWLDFWNLADPVTGAIVSSVRPSRTFGSPGVEYLVSNSPFATRNFVTLWSLTGAATAAPAISGVDVPVAASRAPIDANQKGGSPGVAGCPTPCRIDTGTGAIASAVYRHGSLWFAHGVADSGGVYSRARYARIDVATQTAVEDASFGADGCWYFYPAVAVDAGDALTMVFGRSCTDAYAGVALTTRTLQDDALAPSVVVRDGQDSYVSPIGTANGASSLVNRWGDFFGAASDPVDPAKTWVVGQYAGPRNTWKTWVAETQASPGACAPDDRTLCLGSGRFGVAASWRRPDGSSGDGQAVPITGDTGYFWFFAAENIEVVVKVLDACAAGGHRWVFLGGLTNLEVTLTVTDTVTKAVRAYANPPGTPFSPVEDTAAFACP
ncbi:MAG TPA: hypothetical protein VMH79_10770 [Thermoanaerobaculia bacterium]|nr:hypothetical protein [Thermoanaerobaculia bacterium]